MSSKAIATGRDIVVEVSGHVLNVTFNRPQKKNAFTDAMYASFADAMARLATEDELHCLVIRAAGDVFSAGNDLNDFLQPNETGLGKSVVRLLHALAVADKPLIAAVDGPAVGIGTTLLLHCDFVMATTAASFHTPFAQLGLVPEAGSSLLFPAMLGHRRAMEMFLLGTALEATRALDCGLINHIVDSADLNTSIAAITDQISALPAGAVRATKRLCRTATGIDAGTRTGNRTGTGTLTQVIDREVAEFATRLQSRETREAIEKALNRRR